VKFNEGDIANIFFARLSLARLFIAFENHQ